MVLTSSGTRRRILEGGNGGRRDNLILMVKSFHGYIFDSDRIIPTSSNC